MLSVSVVSDKRAKTRTNTSAETKERGYTAGHADRKVSVKSGLLSYEGRTEWSGGLTRNDLTGESK